MSAGLRKVRQELAVAGERLQLCARVGDGDELGARVSDVPAMQRQDLLIEVLELREGFERAA